MDHSAPLDSPCWRRDPGSFFVGASRIAEKYGLAFSMWAPPVFLDHLTPNLTSLARLDRLFLPSGDPGNVSPLQMLSQAVPKAHALAPNARIFVSLQEYTTSGMNEFFSLLRNQTWPFLTGLLYGPHTRVAIDEFAELARNFPVMSYPDICHGLKTQFPNPHWPFEFALTEGVGKFVLTDVF
jgi:hypothetical protein